MSNAAYAVWASIVRTIVPLIVGGVIAWAVGLGITVDPKFEVLTTTLLTGALTGLYYIAVRLLETYVTPKFGWLLGLAKSPAAYTAPSPAAAPAPSNPNASYTGTETVTPATPAE